MKPLLLTSIIVLICYTSYGFAECTKDIECKGQRICVKGACQNPPTVKPTIAAQFKSIVSFDGGSFSVRSLSMASNEAKRLLDKIGVAADLANMPRIFSGSVANAKAAIAERNDGSIERVIVYSDAFMEKLEEVSGTNWAYYFTFAHELGHHAEGHLIDHHLPPHKCEYQADAFAAKTLRKMGATRKQIVSVVEAFNAHESESHPSSRDRVRNIEIVLKRDEQSDEKQPEPIENSDHTNEPVDEPYPTCNTYQIKEGGCWSRIENMDNCYTYNNHGITYDDLSPSWSGNCLDGKTDGKGKLEWGNGQYYTGYMERGKKVGSGRMNFPQSDQSDIVYDGEWAGNRPTGDGRMRVKGSSFFGYTSRNCFVDKHRQFCFYFQIDQNFDQSANALCLRRCYR